MVASRFTTAAAALILSVAALPTPSHAQASREGPTFAASGAWPGTSLQRPDIAYDPVNDVYLVVSGPMTHGRFQTADGVPLGANEFYISTAARLQPDAARRLRRRQVPGHLARPPQRSDREHRLGLWPSRQVRRRRHADVRRARFPDWCRRRRRASASAARRSPIPRSASGSWSPIHQFGGGGQPGNDIRGQLVSDTGQLVGGSDQHLVRQPFPGRGRRRLQPVERQVPRRVPQLLRAGGAVDDPVADGQRRRTARSATAADVDRRRAHQRPRESPTTPRTTSSCWRGGRTAPASGGIYYGRLMNPEGASAGNATPLIVNYGGYDSLGIDYNVRADTLLRRRPRPRARRRFRRRTSAPRYRASVCRAPSSKSPSRATRLGNYNPRIAASTARNEWMMVTSTAFVARQRAAHQDARQRRRAAAAPTAPAAADRSVRPPAHRTAAGSWPKARKAARRPGSTPSISSPTSTTIPSTRASGSPATTAR